jgi:hypothetical protein
LSVTDFAFPTSLASVAALVTSGGQKLGAAAVPAGPSMFAAPVASLQIWTFAAAGADAGTYEIDLSGTTTYQQAYGVSGATHQAFGFVTDSLSAGTYSASATDFQFPAALVGLSFAVVQNGVILQQGSAGTDLSFTASSGPVVLLASAQPPASGNGIFGLSVQSGGSLLFDRAQVVTNGGFVDEQSVTIGTTGDFDVALNDLQFPAQFSNLALLVSRGSTVLGKIYGGGLFSIAVQPGTYQMAFVATPAANQQYGLYGVRVSPTPPTVTLTATPTALTSGSTTSLSWTTKDATACTGAGGTFVGSQSTGTGSLSVVVEQSTTYTLTCTGDGGTQTASVTVIATAAPKSSSGGGRIDYASLMLLALLWAVSRTNALGRLSLKRRDAHSAT